MTTSDGPSTSRRAGKVSERPASARRSTPSSPATLRGVMTEHRHELLRGPAFRQLRSFRRESPGVDTAVALGMKDAGELHAFVSAFQDL